MDQLDTQFEFHSAKLEFLCAKIRHRFLKKELKTCSWIDYSKKHLKDKRAFF